MVADSSQGLRTGAVSAPAPGERPYVSEVGRRSQRLAGWGPGEESPTVGRED